MKISSYAITLCSAIYETLNQGKARGSHEYGSANNHKCLISNLQIRVALCSKPNRQYSLHQTEQKFIEWSKVGDDSMSDLIYYSNDRRNHQ